MHKTLPTLGNEKEQKQIEFYDKSLGELIFSWVTKNLKKILCTLWGLALTKKSCNNINNSCAHVSCDFDLKSDSHFPKNLFLFASMIVLKK